MKSSISFSTVTLKKRNFFWNRLSKYTTWVGYHDRLSIPAGEVVNLMIDTFPDGRIYYTPFVIVEGVIYVTYTALKNAQGQIIPNCGGMFSHKTIAEHFQQKSVVQEK